MSYNLDPALLGRLGAIEGKLPTYPITVQTPAAAGDVIQVEHGLGRIPEGWIVTYKSAACDLYDAGYSWTTQFMFLKATAAGVLLQIRVY